jgi:hypothetical protein
VTHPKPDHTEDSLAELVRELIGAVKLLSDRFRRKRISDAALAVVVAAVVVFGSLYYFVELPDRRADTRGQIRNLACYAVRLRPPGYSPTSDALRKRYDCPPFVAADLPAGQPTVAPTPGATVTRTASAPTATVVRNRPGAVRTVTVTPTPIPGPTLTRTRTAPGPTHTATRTVRVTTTVTRGVCLPVVC